LQGLNSDQNEAESITPALKAGISFLKLFGSGKNTAAAPREVISHKKPAATSKTVTVMDLSFLVLMTVYASLELGVKKTARDFRTA
jgi:hypothetical protein